MWKMPSKIALAVALILLPVGMMTALIVQGAVASPPQTARAPLPVGYSTDQQGAQAATEVKRRPYVSFAGHDSLIHSREFVRVTTREAWSELWERHLGDGLPQTAQGWPQIPEVDFNQCEVIAFFRGDAWNTNGEIVDSITDRGRSILIRFDSSTYQTAGPDGGGVQVTPFGMWVIPATTKPIVIEENVQGMIGRPPKWKQQHRFE